MKHGLKCKRQEKKLKIAYRGLRSILWYVHNGFVYKDGFVHSAARDTLTAMGKVRKPK